MSKFLEKITRSSLQGNQGDLMIPTEIQKNLSELGNKAGQKYSDIIDRIVDAIFKK